MGTGARVWEQELWKWLCLQGRGARSCLEKRTEGEPRVPPLLAPSGHSEAPLGTRGAAAHRQAHRLPLPSVPTCPLDFLSLLFPIPPSPGSQNEAACTLPTRPGSLTPQGREAGTFTSQHGLHVATEGYQQAHLEEGCSCRTAQLRHCQRLLRRARFWVKSVSQASQGSRLFPDGVWGQTGLSHINWARCEQGTEEAAPGRGQDATN